MKISPSNNLIKNARFNGKIQVSDESMKQVKNNCSSCKNAYYCSGTLQATDAFIRSKDKNSSVEFSFAPTKEGKLQYTLDYKNNNGDHFHKTGLCKAESYDGNDESDNSSDAEYSDCSERQEEIHSNPFTKSLRQLIDFINN